MSSSPPLAFALALATALGLTPLFRALASRFGLLDRPNVRSSHDRVVPRGGGAVLVLATTAALVPSLPMLAAHATAPTLLLGALSLAAIGLCDDRFGLSPLIRLMAQLAVAAVVVEGLGPVRHLPLPVGGAFDTAPLAFAFSVLWIVGVVNIYNFLDGIDGIATVQAVVTGTGVWLAGWEPAAALVAAALAGAAAGFLPYNWSPATIFLGDVGSYFLGYTLAALPLVAPPEMRGHATLFVVSSLWLFLADATLTLLRRARRGERLYHAHREHLYQHLALRYGHARVTTAVGLGAAAATALALAGWRGEHEGWTWLAVGLGIAFFASEWAIASRRRTA